MTEFAEVVRSRRMTRAFADRPIDADVLDELGLSGIEAMGASSVKDGAIYHNKAYVHIPGGRKGLLKILGGGAAPFASKVLAPADSDLAWEMTLDVQAGYEVDMHKHTGPVWGYTRSGAWKYKEYDYVNRAGSFLYEPAGSVHTLQCIEDDTQVWFQMYGSNINLDAQGNVTFIVDGATTLEFYLAVCEQEGLPRPNVLVD